MKNSCLTCTNFATCNVLGIFKDDNGRIPVQMLDVIGSDCTKYFNSEL